MIAVATPTIPPTLIAFARLTDDVEFEMSAVDTPTSPPSAFAKVLSPKIMLPFADTREIALSFLPIAPPKAEEEEKVFSYAPVMFVSAEMASPPISAKVALLSPIAPPITKLIVSAFVLSITPVKSVERLLIFPDSLSPIVPT